MRPGSLDEFFGQQHLLAPGRPLREAIADGQLHSMVFWGPPGVGKTTLARMIAVAADAHFETLSAVLAGVKEIRAAVATAQRERTEHQRNTILFVDEVHRFNKAQQDAFLPFVESGLVILVGATTENPSFELNNALLSRCRVYVLKPLTEEELRQVVEQALVDPVRGLNGRFRLTADAMNLLVGAADGDARKALNLLEIATDLSTETESAAPGGILVERQVIEQVLVSDVRRFDKGGEYFYDQISALHKAVRGSSPDAALYWLVRMLDGGCDPLYVARRMLRMASEDIGNADPRALGIARDAWDVQERLGSPEGELALAQAVIYLAVAPKSNAVYGAWQRARADVRSDPSYEVPLHLRNAATGLMRELGYGADYRYAHDEDGFAAGESYFPAEIPDRCYYQPVGRGLEIRIGEKLQQLRAANRRSPRQRYPGQQGDQ